MDIRYHPVVHNFAKDQRKKCIIELIQVSGSKINQVTIMKSEDMIRLIKSMFLRQLRRKKGTRKEVILFSYQSLLLHRVINCHWDWCIYSSQRKVQGESNNFQTGINVASAAF